MVLWPLRSEVGRSGSARLLASLLAAGGSVVALWFFLFVDFGGTVSGQVHVSSGVLAALWAGPFWLFARLVRTRMAALLGECALFGVTVSLLAAVFRDTHSTAGIGLFSGLVMLYPLAVLVLAIDRAVSGSDAGESTMVGFARRVLAAGVSFVVVISGAMTVLGLLGLATSGAGETIGDLLSVVVFGAVTIVGVIAIRWLWSPTVERSEDHRSVR